MFAPEAAGKCSAERSRRVLLVQRVRKRNCRNSSPLRRGMSLLAVLLTGMSAGSWALAGSLGGIAGTITDAGTGAPIPGVHLQISSPSQTATVTTDAKGHFIIFSLQPDDYTLTAVKEGYNTRAV